MGFRHPLGDALHQHLEFLPIRRIDPREAQATIRARCVLAVQTQHVLDAQCTGENARCRRLHSSAGALDYAARRCAPAPSSSVSPGSPVIATSNLTIQFGARPLFENVSVKFGNGNRYGLIGANGCGKSTFMKILGGDLEPSSGNVMRPADVRIGKLRQDQFAYEELSVLDTVIMGHTALWQVKAERDRIYSLPHMSEEDGMAVAELEVQFAEMDGYTAEARAGELLLGLGIALERHTGPMSAVAPGWKLRVLLAQALFSDPDVLLLDEPTNHLDINTIRWLENVLKARTSTMVIISHDRHFLNSVCTHMADLDYGALKLFPGNYDAYMTAATQARELVQNENAKKKTQIAELQAFVSRFSANASKAKQATSRARQIEKIELTEVKPSSRQSPFIRFDQKQKLHRQAVTLRELTKGYGGEPLIRDFSIQVEAGERIAIIGPNGAGKTTLLRCLMGELAPDGGELKWAEMADIGYYAQDHATDFAEDVSLFDWMKQWTKGDEQLVRGTLGRMLFSQDEIGKSVKVISGGEQGRMLFGKLILQRPNVMVLDEPTNHLDMESIEALNLALENYPGTLIFVSHDREFVSSLANRILEFTPAGITDFSGSYDEYLHSLALE
jgi:ATPase subunit of ABC transporter with duplicated ATPase domains